MIDSLIKIYVLLIMFHPKAITYEQMEKQKKEKKFKQNSYEEIRKLVEDGGEMTLKETSKTKKDNNKNDIKIKFNLFD